MQRSGDSSETATITRMAAPTRLIPVIVGTSDMQTTCDSPRTMTVTRMVTPTCRIPVTVDTFETKKETKPKSDDSYKNGDSDPPDPGVCSHCWHATNMSKPENEDTWEDGDPDPPNPCDCWRCWHAKKMSMPKSGDSCEDGDPAPPDPRDGWHLWHAHLPALAILLFTVLHFPKGASVADVQIFVRYKKSKYNSLNLPTVSTAVPYL